MWSSTPSEHVSPPRSRVQTDSARSAVVDADGSPPGRPRTRIYDSDGSGSAERSVSGQNISNFRLRSSTSSDERDMLESESGNSIDAETSSPATADATSSGIADINATTELDTAADFLFFDQPSLPLVAGEDSAASVPACILRVSEIAASCADQGVVANIACWIFLITAWH